MTWRAALSLALVGQGVAAAEGDLAYGEYLAAECKSCHSVGADAGAEGAPPISGWDEESFVAVLRDFGTGNREHEVMEMIAARLGEEERAALAAYFARLE